MSTVFLKPATTSEMSRFTHLLIIFPFFICTPLTAHAEKGYASDQVEVLVRTGPSHKHAIVKVLKSGAELEILERDRSSGHTRVRTSGGVEGWVLTRHLMTDPAARVLLAELSNQFSDSEDHPTVRVRRLSLSGISMRC